MNFRQYTDEDLLRTVHNQDPMATSALELELAKRLADNTDEYALDAGILEVLDDFGMRNGKTSSIEHVKAALQFAQDYSLEQVRAVMELALEHDVDTAALLKPRLELADQIDDIGNDAGDAIAALNKIFNPATTN